MGWSVCRFLFALLHKALMLLNKHRECGNALQGLLMSRNRMSRKPGQKPFWSRTISVFLVQYPLIVIALFAVWWFFGWFYLIIGVVLVAALMLLIAVIDRKAAKVLVTIAQGNWRKHMETLLYRGYDRGFMVVEAPDAKRSMQLTNRIMIIEAPATERYMEFTKLITEKGVTLQFQFPRAPGLLSITIGCKIF